MTGEDDYEAFIISRLIAGLFGAMPTILGPSLIIETTFLHQRGKAFLTYELSVLLGVIAGPTVGGIIVDVHPWPVTFWWTIGPLAVAALLVFLFLEESGFDREHQESWNPERASNFIHSRIATFFPGNHAVRHMGRSSCPSIHYWDLARRSDCRFLRIPNFWLHYRAQRTASNIPVKPGVNRRLWLLPATKRLLWVSTTPLWYWVPARGLYSLVTLTTWMSLIIAETFGIFASDRIPLWASRRLTKGIWYPENRLWNLILPGLLSPIGLGIFGASLEYHYHYMLLAFGTFLVGFSAVLSVPIIVNYVVDCFVNSATEVAVIMNVYRLALGLALPSFVEAWSDAVGKGWLFGMAAFFSLFAALLVALLAWKGRTLRRFTIRGMNHLDRGRREYMSWARYQLFVWELLCLSPNAEWSGKSTGKRACGRIDVVSQRQALGI